MTTNTPDDFRRCRQRTFTEDPAKHWTVKAATDGQFVWLECDCPSFLKSAKNEGLNRSDRFCKHIHQVTSLVLPQAFLPEVWTLTGNAHGRAVIVAHSQPDILAALKASEAAQPQAQAKAQPAAAQPWAAKAPGEVAPERGVRFSRIEYDD